MIPLEKWLPGIVPNASQISIRYLLGMKSGLYSFENDTVFQRAIILDPLKQWQAQELVEIANQHDPLFQPGEKYDYSNTNYIILGILIEKITGKTVQESIKKPVY